MKRFRWIQTPEGEVMQRTALYRAELWMHRHFGVITAITTVALAIGAITWTWSAMDREQALRDAYCAQHVCHAYALSVQLVEVK